MEQKQNDQQQVFEKKDDTSGEQTVKRGEDAIQAQKDLDTRPGQEKDKEAKADAEKWRNEG